MRKLKLITAYIIAAVILLSILASCDNKINTDNEKGLRIVTTIFPQYDWTRRIISGNEENVELTLLIDNGTDFHNYQPSTEDILKISSCDVLIYGGESDSWIDDLLKSTQNEEMTVINMLEVIGDKAKTEEIKEGMEEGHSHIDNSSKNEHEEEQLDEHVWLSLKNAQTLCSYISGKLTEKTSDYAETYKENADKYNSELASLDKAYEETVSKADCKTLLFADRFPFRYLTDDYGIEYFAAFPGCSAETEASFETIAYLSNKASELNLKYLMTVDNSDTSIAETIIQNSKVQNQEILSLQSMQSISREDIENNETYLKIMKDNLNILKKALNAN